MAQPGGLLAQRAHDVGHVAGGDEHEHLVAAGENVAYGYPNGRAVVNQGWMKSEGHRANILSRGFKLVAVAARRDDDGTWYAAQVFGRR